ncbi:MAG: hypothetical protein MUP03_00225, partial [Anaerolineales bacterium]|nr:hypothetical protein [Anaerolineales bacterium]
SGEREMIQNSDYAIIPMLKPTKTAFDLKKPIIAFFWIGNLIHVTRVAYSYSPNSIFIETLICPFFISLSGIRFLIFMVQKKSFHPGT